MTLIGIWKYLLILLHDSGKNWHNVLSSDRYVITVTNGLISQINHTRFQRGRVTPPPILSQQPFSHYWPGLETLVCSPGTLFRKLFNSLNLPIVKFITSSFLWPALKVSFGGKPSSLSFYFFPWAWLGASPFPSNHFLMSCTPPDGLSLSFFLAPLTLFLADPSFSNLIA